VSLTRLTTYSLLLFGMAWIALAQPVGQGQEARLPNSVPSFIKPKINPATHQLAVGDMLEFNLEMLRESPTSELRSSNFTVRADGTLELPIVGQIQVAGQRLSQVSALIDARLKKKLRNPRFRLGIVSVAPVQVLILGEVSRPGRYDIAPGSGFQEAVAVAGGFSPLADPNAILIQDGVTNKTERVKKPTDADYQIVPLKNADIVYVLPGKKINVIGEVFNPGQYSVPTEAGTVVDALSAAGGAKPTAALKRTILFRPRSGQAIPANLGNLILPTLNAAQASPSLSDASVSQTLATTSANKPESPLLMEEGDVLIVPPRQAVVIAATPKAIPLIGGENIMDVITQSGIPAQASLDNVRLVRSGGDKVEQINVRKFLEEQDRSVLVPIHDGDIVVIDIPEKSPFGLNIFANMAAALMNPFSLLQLLNR